MLLLRWFAAVAELCNVVVVVDAVLFCGFAVLFLVCLLESFCVCLFVCAFVWLLCCCGCAVIVRCCYAVAVALYCCVVGALSCCCCVVMVLPVCCVGVFCCWCGCFFVLLFVVLSLCRFVVTLACCVVVLLLLFCWRVVVVDVL